jgi:hypothetical protein
MRFQKDGRSCKNKKTRTKTILTKQNKTNKTNKTKQNK